ncbi:MAG: chemotaxis protein CheW [Cyanobacteria bacterium P01_B01_bin.77]
MNAAANSHSTQVNSQKISFQPGSSTNLQLDPLGLAPIPEDSRQRFLRFRLSGEDVTLLPLTEIAEVLQLTTAEILPIPDVPPWLLGVCNWRGEMLWLVDASRLVGGVPLWHQVPTLEHPMVIVVRSSERTVGLLVEQVDDVDLIAPETIVHLQNIDSPILAPLIAGHLPDHQGIILDAALLIEHSFRTLS